MNQFVKTKSAPQISRQSALAFLAATLALPLLTGCFVHVRRIPIPKAPGTILTASATDLVEQLNKRAAEIHSFSATVDIHATVTSEEKGEIRDYTDIRSYILYREPQELRVLGLLPVVHTKAFDLVSNPETFRLYIPSKSKVIEGSNTVGSRSTNTFENLRPAIFLDSFLLHGAREGENYFLASEVNSIETEDRKHMLLDPEYELNITKSIPGSRELLPIRAIHFHRENLQPFEQDIYDSKGSLETQVLYGPDQAYGDSHFPGSITIRRPLEHYEITITIDKLQLNQTLADDQFSMEIPDKTTIQKVK